MKKLFTLFAIVGLVSLQSCTVTDNAPLIDNDTISEVFEVTTNFNTANGYTKIVGLNPSIFASDVVLVYHLYNVVNGQDVWRPMPQTYYIDNGGAIDYNFDFTRNDVKIFMGANFALNTVPSSWTQNQTFRIVIVPGKFSSLIDKNNYIAVMAALNLKETQVQKINF
jgi:hypothetical protein